MYVFMSKKQINDNYYFEIYFMGCVTLLKVTKENYNDCELNFGDVIPDEMIEQRYYKKGYDLICSLKLK